MAPLVRAQHALARRRRIVVRDHRLTSDLFERHAAPPRERMLRAGEQDDVVAAEREGLDAFFGRLKRDDAEVDRALEHRRRHLTRRDASHVHDRVRMRGGEPLEQRQQRVDRRLVGADDQSAAAQLLQLPHRGLRLAREADEPLRVVLQQLARLGQRAVARRPIEEPLAELVLEPANGLADGRLRAVKLARRGREAALGGDDQERGQVRQLHAQS